MAFLNPYRRRLGEFPGRLFPFEDVSEDTGKLKKLVEDTPGPIVCEIGSGSGQHLIELAKRSPESKCFGFEIRFKRSVRTLEKATAAGLENIFLLRVDARMIDQIFSPSTIDVLHVNFPDPWEKRTQQKHRLLQPHYLEVLFRLLKRGGVFSFKTDHEDYFDAVDEALRERSDVKCVANSRDLFQSEFLSENIRTEFESMFLSQKKRIYFLRAERQ